MLKCEFCTKQCKNKNSYAKHKIYCKFNPERKYTLFNNLNFQRNKKKGNQFICKKYEKHSENTKNKISKSLTGKILSKEHKNNISEAMKLAVIKNPNSYSKNNVCGRNKIIEYNGVNYHSTWEVIVAKYFEDNNIQYIKNNISFNYIWNGNRKYFPDFYLPLLQIFVEVKGYETERDRAKWYFFPEKILILKSKEINQIINNEYNVIRHMAAII